jgi:hypothetical protein
LGLSTLKGVVFTPKTLTAIAMEAFQEFLQRKKKDKV